MLSSLRIRIAHRQADCIVLMTVQPYAATRIQQ